MPFDDLTDRVLLGRAAQKDATAFEELYRRYCGPVGAFLYRMCWDRHVAEDCLQEAFMRLWRSAGDFRGRSAVGTYVFQIAKNVWLNVRDKRSRHAGPSAPAGEEAESGGSQAPHEALEADELRARVREAIDRLDEPHRMVFVLAHYEGLRYREIAEILEVPLGTVKSRMAASERKLRETLAPYLDQEVRP
jgi:RNA polymerase sigma-70 factor (ECF subfamily)